MSNSVIAIDGPAASGKSTIAQQVAEKIGALYINTGNMYRAAAYAAVINNMDLDNMDEEKFSKFVKEIDVTYMLSPDRKLILMLNGDAINLDLIRTSEVSQNSSKIAASEVIRIWLVDEQRTFTKFGLIVMEGRDIGTNVFPEAKYKFFLTASPEVRAMRRLKQDGETPADSTIKRIAKEISERDKRDSSRKIAPLKQANDAILVDSSAMNIDEVVDTIVKSVSLSVNRL